MTELQEREKAANEMLQALVCANSIVVDTFLERYTWLKPPKTGVVWGCRCDQWNWVCENGWVCKTCGTHAKDCGLPIQFGDKN